MTKMISVALLLYPGCGLALPEYERGHISSWYIIAIYGI